MKDLNICVDYNNKKVSLIVILGGLQIDVYKLPILKMARKMTKKIKRGNSQSKELEKLKEEKV